MKAIINNNQYNEYFIVRYIVERFTHIQNRTHILNVLEYTKSVKKKELRMQSQCKIFTDTQTRSGFPRHVLHF